VPFVFCESGVVFGVYECEFVLCEWDFSVRAACSEGPVEQDDSECCVEEGVGDLY